MDMMVSASRFRSIITGMEWSIKESGFYDSYYAHLCDNIGTATASLNRDVMRPFWGCHSIKYLIHQALASCYYHVAVK